MEFLRAAYADLRCEVKVCEEYSEPFVVTNGLRQGCLLSPLFVLFVYQLTDSRAEEGRSGCGL